MEPIIFTRSASPATVLELLGTEVQELMDKKPHELAGNPYTPAKAAELLGVDAHAVLDAIQQLGIELTLTEHQLHDVRRHLGVALLQARLPEAACRLFAGDVFESEGLTTADLREEAAPVTSVTKADSFKDDVFESESFTLEDLR